MGRSVLVAALESYLDIVMYSSVLRSLVWLQALVFHCVTFFYEIQRLATAVESSSRLGRSTARVMTSSLSTPLVGLSTIWAPAWPTSQHTKICLDNFENCLKIKKNKSEKKHLQTLAGAHRRSQILTDAHRHS